MKTQFERLGDFVKIKTGKLDANASSIDGAYPFFTCSETPLKIASYSYDCECILVAGNGDLNVKYYKGKFDAYQRTYIIESLNSNRLNVRFLYYFMSSYMEKLRSLSIGGVIKYIKLNYLTDAQIFLPPLAEQIHIAQVLDQADRLRQQDRQLLAHYDQLVQAVFVDMFGDPMRNEKGWPMKRIASVAKVITGNTPSRAISDYYGNYLEWIKSDNINTPSHFLTTAKEYLSETGSLNGRTAPKGAILMTCIAGSLECIGNVAITDRKVAFNQQINALIPNKQVTTEFLYAHFLSSKKKIQEVSTGGMKGMVSKGKLEEVEIIVPPIPLQAIFSNNFNQIITLIKIAQTSAEQSEALFNSLLQQAFRGELGRGPATAPAEAGQLALALG